MRKPDNIFERHPKKTIAMVLFFGFIAIVFGFEKYLEWKNVTQERPGKTRHIRLRENPPLTVYPVMPNAHYMNTVTHFDPDKHMLRVDEQGFLHPSRVHEHADVSIVFLGGSTTECRYVEEENRFPFVVGRLLENSGRKVNSYNGGVAGNDTLHSINILMNKVIPMRPDIVVVMHNINDIAVLLHENTYWNSNPTRGSIIKETPWIALSNAARQLKNMLVPNVYIKMRNFVHKLRVKLHYEADEFANSRGSMNIDAELLKNSFGKNLQALIHLCRVQAILPVFMTMPSRLSENPDDVVLGGMGNLPADLGIEEYHSLMTLFNIFNDTIRSEGRKNNVLVIDLDKNIPQENQYIYDVIHFTDKGALLTARIIAEELEKHVLYKKR